MSKLIIAVMLLVSSIAAAGDAVVSWKGPASVSGAPGGTVVVKLEAVIPPGWHTYSAKPGPGATRFAASPSCVSKVGQVAVDKFVEEDVGFGSPSQTVSGTAYFMVPLVIDGNAPIGNCDVDLEVTYQLCSGNTCQLPVKTVVRLSLDVAGDKVRPETGLLSYFLMAMGAGFLSLLTPCVFPMIPITVSFFVKRKQVSRLRTVADAMIFSAGIVGASTVVGMLFSVVFNATSLNQVVTSPWFNLFFAGLVLFFAANLFGMLELSMPSALINGLSKSSLKRDGWVSLVLMGLLFALTSFTCTGPFIGQTLVEASRGDWMWPFFGMLGYSIAFASPFFLLALFPSLLRLLPKSGGWLNSVKVVMGFVETAFSLKFLSSAALVWGWSFLSRDLFLCTWMALFTICSTYLLGWFQLANDTPVDRLGGLRMLMAAVSLSFAIWLGTGLAGRDMGVFESYLPPGAASEKAGSTLLWSDDLTAAEAESKRTGLPILLEFSGYTCSNCNLMERKILPLPAVEAGLRGYLRVRLYTDGEMDATQSAKSAEARRVQVERFKTAALPLYVVISPDGREVARLQGMTYDPADFIAFLSLYNAQRNKDAKP